MLRTAVRKADAAHCSNAERYYVVAGDRGNLIVMNRREFRKFKQKGYISRKAFVDDLIIESFYFTPYRNESGQITDALRQRKIAAFYAYRDAWRRKRKESRIRARAAKAKAKENKKGGRP